MTLMEGFRLFCLAEGKQATTVRWYMGKLKVFVSYLQAQNLPITARADDHAPTGFPS